MRLKRWLLGLTALGALLLVWAVMVEPRWLAVRTMEVELPHWSGPAGLKVVVASDWHLTRRSWWRVTTPERARAIVRDINAVQPDIVLLPGDFIADRDFRPETEATAEDEIAAILGELRARYGVYAVLGNHDWWHGGEKFMAALRSKGITVLENDALPLPDLGLWLVGVGDDSTGHSYPRRALAKLPPGQTALVVMHDPASLMEMPAVPGVVVAGHTHGGQIQVPGLGALIVPGAAPKEWAWGWVNYGGNRMYVTSGIGVSIVPVRLNMRPEWAIFRLRAGQQQGGG